MPDVSRKIERACFRLRLMVWLLDGKVLLHSEVFGSPGNVGCVLLLKPTNATKHISLDEIVELLRIDLISCDRVAKNADILGSAHVFVGPASAVE